MPHGIFSHRYRGILSLPWGAVGVCGRRAAGRFSSHRGGRPSGVGTLWLFSDL